jgi:ABC-type antimicrobial peptide transport system permease subunit
MSANIYEQTQEISLMLALGMKKSMVIRLFIYEALVLVVSSSMVGFVIGVFIGNIMKLQQATIEYFPFSPELPFDSIKVVLGLSIIFAVMSTYGSIRKIINSPIAEISRTSSTN